MTEVLSGSGASKSNGDRRAPTAASFASTSFLPSDEGFFHRRAGQEEGGISSSLGIHIGVVGSNFKTTPITEREAMARTITLETLSKLGQRGPRGLSTGSEMVLLSTCNRVEVYFASERLEESAKEIRALFDSCLNPKGFRDNWHDEESKVYAYADRFAIEHLFDVASGLDSLVIGEAQILSQVREASKRANEMGLSGPALSKLFSKACTTGKEIRESYPRFTNGFRNSVGRSVVDLISKHFEKDFTFSYRPKILLVGSGKMIRLVSSLFSHQRFGRIIVAARRSGLREIEADRIVSLAEVPQILVEEGIDVVVTATASDGYVLGTRELELYASSTTIRNRSLLIVDIAVPRNVDPQISARFQCIDLVNLDDLKERVSLLESEDENRVERSSQLIAIHRSISVRTNEFLSWMCESSDIAPLMVSLRRKAEKIRSEEVDNALMRITELTPGQKEVIRKMSDRIVRRLLHEPSKNLRDAVRNGEAERSKDYASLLRTLFGLDLSSEANIEQNRVAKEKERA